MILYGYWRSSASYRVRIALALKGIEVEHVPVNLREGEQRSPAHISRQPQGFVPVLQLEDGTQLTQSLAIMTYLADRHGKFTYPAGSLERARQDALTHTIVDEFDALERACCDELV